MSKTPRTVYTGRTWHIAAPRGGSLCGIADENLTHIMRLPFNPFEAAVDDCSECVEVLNGLMVISHVKGRLT